MFWFLLFLSLWVMGMPVTTTVSVQITSPNNLSVTTAKSLTVSAHVHGTFATKALDRVGFCIYNALEHVFNTSSAAPHNNKDDNRHNGHADSGALFGGFPDSYFQCVTLVGRRVGDDSSRSRDRSGEDTNYSSVGQGQGQGQLQDDDAGCNDRDNIIIVDDGHGDNDGDSDGVYVYEVDTRHSVQLDGYQASSVRVRAALIDFSQRQQRQQAQSSHRGTDTTEATATMGLGLLLAEVHINRC